MGYVITSCPPGGAATTGCPLVKKFVFDPDYRVDLHRFMSRTVAQRFPELHIGSVDAPAQVILPDFGNAITPIAAGCEVVYPLDNYPWNHHLPLEKIRELKVPACLDEVFPYSEIKNQVGYLNRKLDQDVGVAWNSRGVLNDAALIGGPAFLGDFGLACQSDPSENASTARRLVAYSNGMLTSVIRANHSQFHYQGMVMLTNCTLMMVSPAMFEKSLIDYDLAVFDLVKGQDQLLGVHHCGSFEKYARVYRRIPEISWIETGWGSDIRLTLDLFPEAIVQYILSAVFVSTASRSAVREKIQEILETARGDWNRFRLSMPDVEAGTPDENLLEIYECCQKARKTHE